MTDQLKRRFLAILTSSFLGLFTFNRSSADAVLQVDNLDDIKDYKKISKKYSYIQTRRFSPSSNLDSGAMYRLVNSKYIPFENRKSYIERDGVKLYLPSQRNFLMIGREYGSTLDKKDLAIIESDTIINIDGDYFLSAKIDVNVDNVTIYGEGKISFKNNSIINFIGKNINLNVQCIGNESIESYIDRIDIKDKLIWTKNIAHLSRGDLFTVIQDSEKGVASFSGQVESVSNEFFKYSLNKIDGSDLNATHRSRIIFTAVGSLNKSIQFTNSTNVFIGESFTNSSVDVCIENSHEVIVSAISLYHSNFVIRFCKGVTFTSLHSQKSRFYGLTIQASKRIYIGYLYCNAPGFSGLVIKGGHDIHIDKCLLERCPVMSLQCVSYPGTIPSLVDETLQNSLSCDNVTINSLQVNFGNWISSIKSTTGLKIYNLSSSYANKAFFLDSEWRAITILNVSITNHDPIQNLANTSTTCFIAQKGIGLVIKIQDLSFRRAINNPLFVVHEVSNADISYPNKRPKAVSLSNSHDINWR